MALQNDQYDLILREYSRRQARARRLLEERRFVVYRQIPRLRQIDEEVVAVSADKARRLLLGKETGTSDLKAAIQKLQAERSALLTGHGYPEDYLELPCECPLCQDTGYLDDGQKCSCFKRAEIELLYSCSNLSEILEEENFEHFSFEFYSDTIINNATGLSARETAQKAYDSALQFVRTFDSAFENLFLYGDTGVGKTFLSHCIAQRLLESAHSVLYFSAFDFFDAMAEHTFSKKERVHPPDDGFLFDCDLLIIDDLGTELTNSFVASRLFLCINERIMRRKSTIISTNLSLENFSDTYSERTFSRIASNYQMIKLVGKDIRIQKLFLGGK